MKNKMLRSVGIVLLVIVLFQLTGCGVFQSEESFNVEIYQGTRGLEVMIMDSAPPLETYEEEPFKIVSKLVNEGAYQITNGVLTLNFEREYVELIRGKKNIQFSLNGKDPSNPWDDEEVITYELKSKYLDEKSEIHTTILQLTSCYDYETLATFAVCIDTNIFETRPKDTTCTVSDQTSSGQGAPLAVVKIEQDISGGDYITPHFTIHIQNKGGGNVMRYGNKQACSSLGIGSENFNLVNLEDVELSEYSLKKGHIRCSPTVIRLRDGEAKIRCSLDKNVIKSTDPSFVTSLKIHFKYGYTRTDSIEMDILNDESKD